MPKRRRPSRRGGQSARGQGAKKPQGGDGAPTRAQAQKNGQVPKKTPPGDGAPPRPAQDAGLTRVPPPARRPPGPAADKPKRPRTSKSGRAAAPAGRSVVAGARATAPLPFMAWRKLAAGISASLLVLAIASLAIRGLAFGLDFTGGTQVEVSYSGTADLPDMRGRLARAGFDDAVVLHFGSDHEALIRLPQGGGDRAAENALAALAEDVDNPPTLRRVEFVGPQVGEELREQGGMALLAALLLVMLYVAFRFQLKFSIGAVVALAHDVLITLGLFALFGWDFDLTVLAALLAVIGYSLNDTIVVSDRIRECFRNMSNPPAEVIDIALTQTLGRTTVTSLTTLLVLLALATLGGELIWGFALALIIGVLVGTYSSIYVVTNVLLAMGIRQDDLLVLEKKEGEDADPKAPR